MRVYRTKILLNEFPFLEGIALIVRVSLEKVNDIKIRRGDSSLLVRKGSEDSYSYCNGGHYDYTKYYAVEGAKVVELASAGNSATGSGERSSWDADTLGEQLFAKGITPDYIVECVRNDTDDNGNGEETIFWTVYKMRGFDLVAHHHQKLDAAVAAIKAEIAAACCA